MRSGAKATIKIFQKACKPAINPHGIMWEASIKSSEKTRAKGSLALRFPAQRDRCAGARRQRQVFFLTKNGIEVKSDVKSVEGVVMIEKDSLTLKKGEIVVNKLAKQSKA
jgi:hypothetical protein